MYVLFHDQGQRKYSQPPDQAIHGLWRTLCVWGWETATGGKPIRPFARSRRVVASLQVTDGSKTPVSSLRALQPLEPWHLNRLLLQTGASGRLT